MYRDSHSTADSLPPFPQLWARWAAVAATCAAARTPSGPRMLPLVAWFTGECGSGSVLHARSRSAAELWGEIREHGGGGTAVRSFSYRWKAGRWYPVEPAPLDERAAALPNIWTTNSTVDTICALARTDSEEQRAAAVTLVCAAEIGAVARPVVGDVFPDRVHFDVDNAMSQFAMAGVLTAGPGAKHAQPRTPSMTDIPISTASLPALAVGAESGGHVFPVPAPVLSVPRR